MAKATKSKTSKTAGASASKETAAKDEIVQNTPDMDQDKPEPEKVEEVVDAPKPHDDNAPKAEDKPTEALVQDAPVEAKVDVEPSVDKAEPVTPTAEPVSRGPGFFPLVLGGVIAAALGWAAATFVTQPPELDTALRARVADVEQTLGTVDGRLTNQDGQIEALKNAPEPEGFDPSVLDGVKAGIATLRTDLTEIDARLTILEKAPVSEGVSEAAIAAYERELANLQASVQQQRAEIEDLLNNALAVKETTEEQARNTAAESALIQVLSALDSGAPFAEPLAEMQETDAVDVPASLQAVADDGVASLADLQKEFPALAEQALAQARADDPDAEPGFSGFLKRQLGARSTVPREGDDPDAVLSRAEAALLAGQLPDALTQLDALPEGAKSKLQDWLTKAQARAQALADAQELAQRLSAN